MLLNAESAGQNLKNQKLTSPEKFPKVEAPASVCLTLPDKLNLGRMKTPYESNLFVQEDNF